jgi:ribosome-binding factor A
LSIRSERIGEQIRDELSRLLRDEVSDPRVGMVSLTRVEAAPDLSTAAVYWSPLSADREAHGEAALLRVRDGLASASGFLRRRLAQELSLRRTPELIFRHDPSLEQGADVLALLRDLSDEREAREARAAGDTEDTKEQRDG